MPWAHPCSCSRCTGAQRGELGTGGCQGDAKHQEQANTVAVAREPRKQTLARAAWACAWTTSPLLPLGRVLGPRAGQVQHGAGCGQGSPLPARHLVLPLAPGLQHASSPTDPRRSRALPHLTPAQRKGLRGQNDTPRGPGIWGGPGGWMQSHCRKMQGLCGVSELPQVQGRAALQRRWPRPCSCPRPRAESSSV